MIENENERLTEKCLKSSARTTESPACDINCSCNNNRNNCENDDIYIYSFETTWTEFWHVMI